MRYVILGIGETLFVSKHRSVTACGWILVAALCLGYAFSLVLCPAFALLARGAVGFCGWWWLLAAGSLVLAAVFFVFCVTTARALVRMGWDHTRRFRHVSALTLGLLLWILAMHLRRDATALPGDYTIEDVPTPGEQAAQSHALLISAFSGREALRRAPCMGDLDCTNSTVEHGEAVLQAWGDLADTRSLLRQLDAFDGIGDLQEPLYSVEGFPAWVRVRDCAQVTWAFCLHKAAQGEVAEAARELALLHSVVRKALPYSRSLFRKMVLITLANGNLGVAERLLADPEQVQQVTEILRPAFSSLTREETSLCGAAAFEYMAARDLLQGADFEQFLYLVVNGVAGEIPEPDSDPTPARLLLSLLYNRNETVRALRKQWDRYIRAAGEPGRRAVPAVNAKVPWGIWIKNPGGTVLVGRLALDIDHAIHTAEALRRRSERVAVVLDHKD